MKCFKSSTENTLTEPKPLLSALRSKGGRDSFVLPQHHLLFPLNKALFLSAISCWLHETETLLSLQSINHTRAVSTSISQLFPQDWHFPRDLPQLETLITISLFLTTMINTGQNFLLWEVVCMGLAEPFLNWESVVPKSLTYVRDKTGIKQG